MLKHSSICLFLSSVFVILLFSECQTGNNWEVSQRSVIMMQSFSFIAKIFYIISITIFIMNLKNYIKIRNRLKFIMIIWFLLLPVPLIIVQLNGIPVDSLRIVGTEFFRQSYIVELVGMGTSLIFLVILLIVFRGRQAIDETTESKD